MIIKLILRNPSFTFTVICCIILDILKIQYSGAPSRTCCEVCVMLCMTHTSAIHRRDVHDFIFNNPRIYSGKSLYFASNTQMAESLLQAFPFQMVYRTIYFRLCFFCSIASVCIPSALRQSSDFYQKTEQLLAGNFHVHSIIYSCC